MSRISLAFRCFFALLFQGALSPELIADLGLRPKTAAPPPAPKAEAPKPPAVDPSKGAVQILAILQRDARLVDFLMEDISPYSDDQVGAAVRDLHTQSRAVLDRYVRLSPVMDAVEGDTVSVGAKLGVDVEKARVKLLGNVPAKGLPEKGTLRHKGWRAEQANLPALDPRQDLLVVAPAEIEIE